MRLAQGRAAGKRGFTLIELLVVVAIIALLISILMPSLARARELSKRTVCASNMKGIGVGFASYAAANNDAWPIPNHPRGSGTATVVAYVNSIGAKRGHPDFPAAGETFSGNTAAGEPVTDSFISTTRAFWQLVRAGNTPKSFNCPSASTDQPNAQDNPQAFWDFGDVTTGNSSATASARLGTADNTTAWKQCSYGYQVPFGQNGTPGPNVDPEMAMVADKGPYGAALEGGLAAPTPVITSSALNSNSSPEEWKRYNSPNHGGVGDGEGQNVMYNDGHAEFFTSPICGVSKDNIYTQWTADSSSTDPTTRVRGNVPTASGTGGIGPYGQTDSLIYP